MFQWARNLFGGGRPAVPAPAPARRPTVQARYDNALNTDENKRNWWMTDVLSAKAAHNYQTRRNLRTRSRYEVANNPYLFGITRSNADDLVDRGPTLKCMLPSAADNRQIEAAWREWSHEVALVEKIRTIKLARTVDGEGFWILKTVEDLKGPVKLYPLDVETDQFTSPAPKNLNELWVDGLELHPVTGRPTAYHALRHHPGDLFFPELNPLKTDRILARYVVQWLYKFRPGQVRGIPVFTPSLDEFTELRAFRKAILAKVQVAANLTAVLEMPAPANAEDNTDAEPFDKLPIDNGMMVTTPGGAKLAQFASSEPSTTYEMFQEKCLGEACRPLNYPLNLALGTSQKFNFSSARLDHLNYRQSLTVERSDCEVVVLDPTFAEFIAEASRVPGLLPKSVRSIADVPHEWHWPGFPMLDTTAETNADLARIAGGTLTWREFWASRGYDWIQVMEQQAAEKKEIERLNLTFGEPMKKTERIDDGAPAAAAA